jgi:hypothetical protein
LGLKVRGVAEAHPRGEPGVLSCDGGKQIERTEKGAAAGDSRPMAARAPENLYFVALHDNAFSASIARVCSWNRFRCGSFPILD